MLLVFRSFFAFFRRVLDIHDQIVYTSAIQGIAGDEPDAMEENMEPLFKAIMGMPKPVVKETAPLQVSYLEIHLVHLFCLYLMVPPAKA